MLSRGVLSLPASRQSLFLQAGVFAAFALTWALELALVKAHVECDTYGPVASAAGAIQVATIVFAGVLAVLRVASELWLRRGKQALLTLGAFAVQVLIGAVIVQATLHVTLLYCGSISMKGADFPPCMLGCAH
jgi:hypothetical protein